METQLKVPAASRRAWGKAGMCSRETKPTNTAPRCLAPSFPFVLCLFLISHCGAPRPGKVRALLFQALPVGCRDANLRRQNKGRAIIISAARRNAGNAPGGWDDGFRKGERVCVSR